MVMFGKAIRSVAACLGRGVALGGALLLIGASAAEAEDVVITPTGGNGFHVSFTNKTFNPVTGLSVGPFDTVGGNAVTGLSITGQPSCGDAGTQKAWICPNVDVAPGATVTGSGTTQNNLVQGSEFKVCKTTDHFATATCEDVVAKPPPPTAHLSVLKVALVRPLEGQILGGDPFQPGLRPGPRALAVEVGGAVFYHIHVRNDSARTAPGISVSDLLPAGCRAADGFPKRDETGLVASLDEDILPGQELYFSVTCLDVAHDLDNSVQVRQDGKPIGVASAQHITVGMVRTAPIEDADSHKVAGKIPDFEIRSGPAFFPVTGVQVAVRRLGVRGCRWLSAKGSFVKRPAHKGSCDIQVWLAAHRVHHWSLRFAHPLKPGRYLIEARTINHLLGAVDDRFSTRAHNKRTLTVR